MLGGKLRGKFTTAVIASFALALVCLQAPAALADDSKITDSSVALSLSSSAASATGVTATISFTTNTFLTENSVIAMALTSSSGFNLDSVSGSNITSSTITGTGSTSGSGSSKVLLFTNSVFSAAGAKTITITGITNPSSSGTATLMISTQGISGLSGSSETATTSISGGSGEGGDQGDGGVTGNNTVTVTVADTAGTPLASQTVGGYCGMSFTTATTNASGIATLTGLTNGNCGVWLMSTTYDAGQENFTFADSSTAQTKSISLSATALDVTLAVTVHNSSGAAVASAYMYLTNQTTGQQFSGTTNSSGVASIGVTYGTYSADLFTSFGGDTSQYLPDTTVTVDSSTSAITLTTQAYTAFITGTIRSASGTALAGEIVAYSDDAFHFSQAASTGYSLGVIPGTYTIKAESSGYANDVLRNVTVTDGETVSAQDFSLDTAGNTVNVSTVNTSGGALSISGSVFCNTAGAVFSPESVYFKQLSNGAATFLLPDGSFSCSVFTTGYVVTSDNTVTVSANSTAALALTLQANDSTLAVQLIDQDGNTISDAKFGVSGKETTHGYQLNGFGENGSTSLSVISGTYDLRAYIMSGNYTTAFEPTTVTLTSGGTTTQNLTVYSKSATLTGTVTNGGGNPVSHVLVTADSSQFHTSTYTNDSGVYSFNVVPDTYSIGAASSDSSNLPAQTNNVVTTANTTTTENLQFTSTTATITVTPTSTSTQAMAFTPEAGSCYAYNKDSGAHVTGDLDSNNQVVLAVSAGTWYTGCRITSSGTDYATTADSAVVVSNNDALDQTVDVASADTNIDGSLVQFSATADATLDAGDFTVSVPANTLDTTGNVSVSISTATTGVVVTDGAFPLHPISLTARDSNGNIITGTFNNNVTITWSYTDQELVDLGIDEDTLAGHRHGDGASYVTDEGYTIDTANNTVSLVTNKFSTYSIVGVQAAVAPSKPTHLSVAKKTISSVVAKWHAPSTGTVTKYKVQMRKFGVKNTAKWKNYKNVTVLHKKFKHLKTATKYQFRVKACNGTACSAYTKWSPFKTK